MSGKAACHCGAVWGITVYTEYHETTLAGMIRVSTGDWVAFVDGVATGR